MLTEDGLPVELSRAIQFMKTGQLAAAEFQCRLALDINPRSDVALSILGQIAAIKGRKDLAVPLFKIALSCTINPVTVQKNQDLALQSVAADIDATAKGPRFLVSKAWGQGFFSDVGHVLGCMLLAEITNRTPIVEWGGKSLYSSSSAANAFEIYFDKISSASLMDFTASPSRGYFPSKWNKSNVGRWLPFNLSDQPEAGVDFMQRPEQVIVVDTYMPVANLLLWLHATHPMHGHTISEILSYLAKKYLHPKQHILDECREFRREKFGDKPFHCIHLRGLDKKGESPELVQLNEDCIRELDHADKKLPILVLTDDEDIQHELTQHYSA